jgi:hypothetical protein
MLKHDLIKKLILIIFGVVIGYFVFYSEDSNANLEYGDSGFPKNCRAIIYENYKQHTFEQLSAKDALDSIYRNCGENGYSWEK